MWLYWQTCISVGKASEGTPYSLQLVGQPFREMVSWTLKVFGGLDYFVQSRRLVQGRCDGGVRLPGQAGGGGGHLLTDVIV